MAFLAVGAALAHDLVVLLTVARFTMLAMRLPVLDDGSVVCPAVVAALTGPDFVEGSRRFRHETKRCRGGHE
ncbi:hypothetical protein C0214_06275 [Methylobacterium sp. DM1]|uniref:Uncharacterized protein n=5 Tax=Methylorubrum extorquens TaxID=408 RepID=C5B3L7_METEA|nr:hypothetical protein Mchl_1026 [Methylorubrum extorquens CM4]ACS43049.1 Hypothetical protein MexAM1_META2p0122 [Methylorubrum extorquens AM1]AWI87934.1 hypothetical protein C0214_06275 [Methylobacterium sp. DM1]EHP92725.1 hypothetical protein MetexDRAFT_2414 [Methylorubrum extorquens DSM 13060]WHQ71021.1 hypothetical protein KEC54_05315 [Methylorubrum extorquens]CAX22968.1 protein of unknown function [Methylorubrum extorquens DM4]